MSEIRICLSVESLSRGSKEVATDNQEDGSQKADMSKKNEFSALYFDGQKIGFWP